MLYVRILFLVFGLPLIGFGQIFAYVIEDFPGYNDGISSINDTEDGFCFINTKYYNKNPTVYSFTNTGHLEWRNELPFSTARDFVIENDTLVFLKGTLFGVELVKMSIDSGIILSNENFSLNQEGGQFYFEKVDSFYVIGSSISQGSGGNHENWDRVCSYLGNDDFQFCHTTYGFAFGSWIEAVTHDNNGNVYFVVNSNGDGDVNRILKMDLDQNIISIFDNLFNGSTSLPVSSKIATTQDYLVAIHNVHGGPTIDFTYYDFDGQLVFDIDFHNPNESVADIIGCENNDVALLGSDNNFSRYSSTGELIWEHDLSFMWNGSPVHVGLYGIEELSNGNFVFYGRLDESSVIFTVDSEGCFSDEECNVVQVGICPSCDKFSPRDLIVNCDNSEDYLEEINQWLERGGIFGFNAFIEDATIDFNWSGITEVGTHQVTFDFEIPSQDVQETHVVELIIEPNQDGPLIIQEPEPLTIQQSEFLEVSVQEWLDQSGNMEVLHNCGSYELSHNFDFDYSVGNHWVEFKATSASGKETDKLVLLSIQACQGEWISQATELTVVCGQDESYKNQIDQWIANQGGLSLTSQCDSIIYSNNWNGSYDPGNYWITFTASGEHTELEYSKGIFMSIQQGNEAPVITNEAADYIALSNDPLLESKIQNWLNSSGGASTFDNCSSFTWSHDFLFDYSPGEYVVTFTAESENGTTNNTSANLTIELASNLEDEIHNDGIVIAPNPVDDILRVTGINGRQQWSIYSLEGKKTLSGIFDEAQSSINLINLPNGIYYIELAHTSSEQKVVKRFLKL